MTSMLPRRDGAADHGGAPEGVEVEVVVGAEPLPGGLVEVDIEIGDDEPPSHKMVLLQLVAIPDVAEPRPHPADQCVDCQGTGVYVGLLERRACPTCGGRGRMGR